MNETNVGRRSAHELPMRTDHHATPVELAVLALQGWRLVPTRAVEPYWVHETLRGSLDKESDGTWVFARQLGDGAPRRAESDDLIEMLTMIEEWDQ